MGGGGRIKNQTGEYFSEKLLFFFHSIFISFSFQNLIFYSKLLILGLYRKLINNNRLFNSLTQVAVN